MFETKHMVMLSLLLFCQGLQTVLSRSFFVSHYGQDKLYCGNSTLPCRSIRFTVNISNHGDEILINSVQKTPYKECENYIQSKCSIELNKSLLFKGVNGTAVIQCKRSCDLFKIPRSDFNMTRIVFINIVLSTSRKLIKFLKTNFRIVLKQCILKKYEIGVNSKASTHCSIKVINSTFEKSGSHGIWTRCTVSLTAHFRSTFFDASPVKLQTVYDTKERWQKTEVFIFNCVFDGGMGQFSSELLKIKPYGDAVNVTILSSKFRNQNEICTQGEIATLLVDDNNFRGRRFTRSFTLKNLLFENNRNNFFAFSLTTMIRPNKPFQAELQNSVFRNNSAPMILGMEFPNDTKPRLHGRAMKLSNITFLKNIKGLKKTSSVIQFGKGRYHLTFCRFLDNIAGNDPYAAVVTASANAVVKFHNCNFENSQTNEKSIQLYGKVNSKLWFEGENTVNITGLKTDQIIFVYMPTFKPPGTILKGTLRILCPQGYHLTGDTQCKGIGKSLHCSYLAASCEQCPVKTYSLERGKLYNNVTTDIQCYNCPRGGQCVEGAVVAKPDFWGYQVKGRISFLSCPSEYCCDTESCTSYDSCFGNRTGALCGKCPDGTSESLFNTKCKPNQECSSFIFWPGISSLLILYLLFFLYHKEITSFVRKGLRLKHPQKIMSRNVQGHNGKASGFIKIIFYFYQVVHLLRNSVASHSSDTIFGNIEKTISEVLNLIVTNVPSVDCPFQNIRPLGKALILHSVGYCLLALVALLGFLSKLLQFIKRFRRNHNKGQAFPEELMVLGSRTQRPMPSPFSVRIVSAFTHISLLMYSSSAQLCFSLLRCVPIGDNQALFIDGNVKCYQAFQFVVLGYAIFSIFPFCLIPVLGSYLLKSARISVTQFCLACIFPLPFCCFWMYLSLKDYFLVRGESCLTNEQENDDLTQHWSNNFTQDNSSTTAASRTAILRVLLGPFRPHKTVLCFPASFIPWEGFLIFRRLLLIIVLTFVYDNRLRMIIVLTICVVILVCHMYVHPFINSRENFMETISLSTLIVLCGFTLMKALYYGEDFSSSSNSLNLLNGFNLVENILIIIPLVVIIFLVILSLSIRFMLGFRFCIRVCYRRLARLCCRT